MIFWDNVEVLGWNNGEWADEVTITNWWSYDDGPGGLTLTDWCSYDEWSDDAAGKQ